MGAELYDCPWCGSAKSIDFGVCQVCMMEFPVETKIITLPTRTLPAMPASIAALGKPGTAKAE